MIDLPENDVDVVEKMLEFLYHGFYSDGSNQDIRAAPTNAPEPASDEFASDEFPSKEFPSEEFISRRKDKRRAADKATAAPVDSPESAAALLVNARVYTTAEQYDIPSLKELSMTKYKESLPSGWNSASFVASLKLLYELTPESDRLLKDVAIKAAGENAQKLADRGEFVTLCKENGEIAFDVLKASFTAKPIPLTWKACIYCGNSQRVAQNLDLDGQYHSYSCRNCGRQYNY